jgi:hypothetical protein
LTAQALTSLGKKALFGAEPQVTWTLGEKKEFEEHASARLRAVATLELIFPFSITFAKCAISATSLRSWHAAEESSLVRYPLPL